MSFSALKPGPVVPPGIEKRPDQAARISQSVDFGHLSDILTILGGSQFLTLFFTLFCFSLLSLFSLLRFSSFSLFLILVIYPFFTFHPFCVIRPYCNVMEAIFDHSGRDDVCVVVLPSFIVFVFTVFVFTVFVQDVGEIHRSEFYSINSRSPLSEPVDHVLSSCFMFIYMSGRFTG